MQCYTFFERVPELNSDLNLVELWRRSWAKHGWRPRVLQLRDCHAHPRSGELWRRVMAFPRTTNPYWYEVYCFLRWLAFAAAVEGLLPDSGPAGRAVLVDYDVMNYGWLPPDFEDDAAHFQDSASPMIFASADGARKILDWLCQCSFQPGELASDMGALMRFCQSRERSRLVPGILAEPGDPGWQNFPAVHYSTGAVARILGASRDAKVETIQRVRPV